MTKTAENPPPGSQPSNTSNFVSSGSLVIGFVTSETPLGTRVFETRTVTGSELFSLLTCPHTTIFTLLSTFSSLEMSRIKNLGDNTALACEIFSSRLRLKNARAYSLFRERGLAHMR